MNAFPFVFDRINRRFMRGRGYFFIIYAILWRTICFGWDYKYLTFVLDIRREWQRYTRIGLIKIEAWKRGSRACKLFTQGSQNPYPCKIRLRHGLRFRLIEARVLRKSHKRRDFYSYFISAVVLCPVLPSAQRKHGVCLTHFITRSIIRKYSR